MPDRTSSAACICYPGEIGKLRRASCPAHGCSAARKQLDWLAKMERIEQEVFPDARPRSEVVVPCTCPAHEARPQTDPDCPIHGGMRPT